MKAKSLANYIVIVILTVVLSCSTIEGPVRIAQIECDSYDDARTYNNTDPVLAALDYLGREMDVFHERTVIYDDLESGGARYQPSGWMGDPRPWNNNSLHLSHSKINPAFGVTCLKIEWHPKGRNQWAGIYWQHPEKNWGNDPQIKGLDLSGATAIHFCVRGESGNEVVKFVSGGIPEDSEAIKGHPMRLSKNWKRYTMDLRGAYLNNFIGGFGWVANSDHNPNGCVFYLDDIYIDHKRLDKPRLIRSFHVGNRSLEENGNLQLRNISYIYDNAIAICALLSSSRKADRLRARLIADAFVELSEFEEDRRLHNAYACGDLFMKRLIKEHHAGDENGEVWKTLTRFPYRFKREHDNTVIKESSDINLDSYAQGTDVGNMSWAALALLHCWDVFGDKRYLNTASALAEWININGSHMFLDFGYSGGYKWNSGKGQELKVGWLSTEHNIDYAVVCRKLSIALPNESGHWKKCADKAEDFVHWAASKEPPRLVTGTIEYTNEHRLSPKPLDPQTWSVLAFRDKMSLYSKALQWAMSACKVSTSGCWGYGFSALPTEKTKLSGIWPEGTTQVALALKSLGRDQEAQTVLRQIQCILDKEAIPKAASGGIPAAYPLVVDTDFGWKYYNLPHIGATSWYILAKNNWNPYWPPLKPRVTE